MEEVILSRAQLFYQSFSTVTIGPSCVMKLILVLTTKLRLKVKNGSDPDHYANTDWMDEIMQTGHMQQHSLSVSGGSENVQFMTSINYSDQRV